MSIKLKNLSTEQTAELLPKDLIFLGYRGSVAHGTHVPPEDPNSTDDTDIMGVFVGSLPHYFGFDNKDTHEKFINEWDSVSYEVRKMFSLLLKCNPNVLSMLWLPKHLIIHEDEFGRLIRENKYIFVSKQAYHAFSGYAYGQLKRMEQFECHGYMGEKRRALVTKHGYDTKNAAHLIRLLRMGIEFLTDGELHVVREDAKQLIEIKKGAWSLEKVKEESTRLFANAEEAFIHSQLPNKPDRQAAESLLMRIILGYYRLKQDRQM